MTRALFLIIIFMISFLIGIIFQRHPECGSLIGGMVIAWLLGWYGQKFGEKYIWGNNNEHQ